MRPCRERRRDVRISEYDSLGVRMPKGMSIHSRGFRVGIPKLKSRWSIRWFSPINKNKDGKSSKQEESADGPGNPYTFLYYQKTLSYITWRHFNSR